MIEKLYCKFGDDKELLQSAPEAQKKYQDADKILNAIEEAIGKDNFRRGAEGQILELAGKYECAGFILGFTLAKELLCFKEGARL